MEENKPVYEHKSMKRYVISILLLFLFLLVLGSIFIYLSCFIIGSIKNLNTSLIMESLSKNKDELNAIDKNIVDAMYFSQGLGNFFTYLILFITISLLLKKDLKEDLFKLKESPKFYSLYTIIAIISFVVITLLINFLFSKIVSDSDNQNVIVNILKGNGCAFMIISTCIFAPVVEELIYRDSIYKLIDNYAPKLKLVLFYIISSLAFALPHMISSIGKVDFLTYILQLIPYLLCGLMLALIYHKSKFNIYVTILCHMANNIIACIQVFIGG